MTPKQKLIVQATFEQIQPVMLNVADRFYSRLFRKHESLRDLFLNSRHKQAAEFSQSLGEIIHRLDKPNELEGYLRTMANRHERFNLAEDHYAEVGKAFVFGIRHALGDKFNRSVANSWNAFFREIGKSIKQLETRR